MNFSFSVFFVVALFDAWISFTDPWKSFLEVFKVIFLKTITFDGLKERVHDNAVHLVLLLFITESFPRKTWKNLQMIQDGVRVSTTDRVVWGAFHVWIIRHMICSALTKHRCRNLGVKRVHTGHGITDRRFFLEDHSQWCNYGWGVSVMLAEMMNGTHTVTLGTVTNEDYGVRSLFIVRIFGNEVPQVSIGLEDGETILAERIHFGDSELHDGLSAGDNDCNGLGFGVIELQDCE
jgi:hypothetical protein